ncbi:MAG TPA: ribosome biogenesis GTP-binding protein YihA/YsxC [Ignavibacteriaceae bacterium]|nr:ribosome biogenesis GTP-binding protein YihA/YsxC [Ignavibacteriaceae bacterium]
MFENPRYIKSVYNLKDLVKDNIPEVILCGRSNVGKSSFINSIFNKKNLAKTSSTPGKTRSINYYLIDEHFYLVDLPGYGYAKTSKTEREAWQKLITDYILTSKKIVLALHFVDSRHNPTNLDLNLNALLNESDIPGIVILSKADKLKQSEMANAKRAVQEIFPELIYGENLFFYSSVKLTNKKEILKRFSALFYK